MKDNYILIDTFRLCVLFFIVPYITNNPLRLVEIRANIATNIKQ